MFNEVYSLEAYTPGKLISLDKFLSEKNNGGKYREQILEAQKYAKKTPEYAEAKLQVGGVLANFNCVGGVGNKNLTTSTGHMYMDSDYIPVKHIDVLKNKIFGIPHVVAVWTSLSKMGIGCFFRVEGMTTENFHSFKTFLLNEYNDINWDVSAISKSRKVVQSIDDNVLRKYDALPLSFETVLETLQMKGWVDTTKVEKKKPKSYDCTVVAKQDSSTNTDSDHKFLHYNEEYKYIDPYSDVKIYPEKVAVARVFPPNVKYHVGIRNTSLFKIAVQLCHINDLTPIDHSSLFHCIMDWNSRFCVVPLEPEEVSKLCYSALSNYQGYPAQKYLMKYLHNKNVSSSLPNVSPHYNTLNGLERKENTKSQIINFIDNYSHVVKITQPIVAENLGLSLRTIKSYWNEEIKSIVKQRNLLIKNIRS